MSLFSKVTRAMRTIAPLELADLTWDNVGVLVGKFFFYCFVSIILILLLFFVEPPYPAANTSRVFLTIDLTPQVLDEALNDPKVKKTNVYIMYSIHVLT